MANSAKVLGLVEGNGAEMESRQVAEGLLKEVELELSAVQGGTEFEGSDQGSESLFGVGECEIGLVGDGAFEEDEAAVGRWDFVREVVLFAEILGSNGW